MRSEIELFSRTIHTSWNRFSDITAFRQVARHGMASAARHIYEESVRFTTELYTDPQYDELFLDKKGAVESLKPIGGLQGMAQLMTDNQIKTFQKSVDAASLIFGHSVLDAVALDFCRVIGMISPSSWEPFIDQKQIKLHEFRGQTYETVLEAKVDEYLKALDREPLLTKLDRLFAICKPDKGFAPVKDYKYDRDRLANLDANRHAVVHKLNLETPLPKGDEDLWFLMSTSNYLMVMLLRTFGLKIDPLVTLTGAKATSPESS